jgi:hypothetical protein
MTLQADNAESRGQVWELEAARLREELKCAMSDLERIREGVSGEGQKAPATEIEGRG